MIDTLIGNLGHFFVILAFVSALLAAYSYYQVTTLPLAEKGKWRAFARGSFYFHIIAVLGVVSTLFIIIYQHKFEYHYAWSHSSRSLPAYYMISAFWEGQEGSFLLWIFWHAVLGFFLIHTNKKWEGPMMTIFALVQAFLVSMILGVVIFNIKIGSTPFMLLRDAMADPVFLRDPNFIPADGTGLNPLLQNYWMVIHPPTLFLGFAFTLVPFSYCISGLWTKNYKDWVRPALPWAHAAALVLGVGIMMGAIWAYETLNFGGYWNWDPVENAVYVPWLILVAGIHTMITFKKSNTALKASIILVISSFVLILYSTFLTRSGILGNASVHSFTDLGLSGQLLVYMLFFSLGALILAARAWKHIPTSQEEISNYSREFWIFIGALTLGLMAFQVLIPTSILVFNAIVEMFGGLSNMAPPADQVEFYTKFQLWFAIAVAILSGTGQFFWWKNMEKGELWKEVSTPLIVTMLLSSVIILLARIGNIAYMILLTASIYSILSNSTILFRLAKKKFTLAAGSVAHIGIALMLIGILFSSGYSKVISINNTGRLINRELSDEMNLTNVVVWYGDKEPMGDYIVHYKSKLIEARNIPGYIALHLLEDTADPNLKVARSPIVQKGKTYASAGDTISVYGENTFFEVGFERNDGHTFTLYPRAQVNPSMGLIASPDIKKYFGKDLYSHVSSIPNPELEIEWGDPSDLSLKIGEQFFLNDYVAYLERVERLTEIAGVRLGPEDVAVKAVIKVLAQNQELYIEPLFIIKDRMVGRIADERTEIGAKMVLNNILPEENSFEFSLYTTQKEWIVLKAMEKPMINLLWIGTILLMIGFGLAISRRYKEFKSQQQKEE
jgi:cytochrome c-type biogenesis protein CcmF